MITESNILETNPHQYQVFHLSRPENYIIIINTDTANSIGALLKSIA